MNRAKMQRQKMHLEELLGRLLGRRSRRRKMSGLLGLALVLWLGSDGLSRLWANHIWFAALGYGQVLGLRLWLQGGLGTIAALASALFLGGNLRRAWQLVQAAPTPESALDRAAGAQRPALYLGSLLPLTLGLGLLLMGLAMHHVQQLVQLWTPAAPPPVVAIDSWLAWLSWPGVGWGPGLGLGLAGAIALLLYPQVLLRILAMGLSLSAGSLVAAHWGQILQAWHAVPFERADPVFGKDIGFYIFALPLWELLQVWLAGLALYAWAAVGLVYLLAHRSLSNGRFEGLTAPQLRHLYGLSGGLMATVALGQWLQRYQLLYSTRGVTYGASYIDVQVSLPVHTALCGLAAAIALYGWGRSRSFSPLTATAARRFSLFPPLLSLAAFLLLSLLTTQALPAALQRLLVQPNEFAKEQPYIRRSIDFTRAAFGLTGITPQVFDPQNDLTAADLRANAPTIRNIRLWDTRPLLQTNRQLQQIRPYYRFFDADIDRYILDAPENSPAKAPARSPARSPEKTSEKAPEKAPEKAGRQRPTPVPAPVLEKTVKKTAEKRQVLIAARELDYRAVPPAAQTWVNQHLVYTHGYGFTMSPVNTVAEGGLPDYFVKDIGTDSRRPGSQGNTAQAQIRAHIPTVHPRIYFGELTDTYVMTDTRVQELDYPSGDANVYNVYDGSGGVPLGDGLRRGLFARYLQDWRLLLSQDLRPQTQLLFRRNIRDRIQAIAPFLQLDPDPYLVVADVPTPLSQPPANSQAAAPNALFWVLDAYTTSDRYPQSDPGPTHTYNYIRNAVKVVIDAYNGSVNFYISDATDPIIQAWSAAFPGMFQPLNALPTALRRHLRYPTELFKVQSERLMTYHMTDPQVFYNREDLWQVPNEIYGTQTQPVEPYSLIMKLPTADTEEFVLLLPFTPNQRTNLTAWFAARSDGSAYGTSLLYLFPKQELVFGPEQIEARINQDPTISQKISLWNREGSRALQGNLLVIPINHSLLYVEPLYLEAQQNSLPTLIRVIVAYGNRIVMAETLEAGLNAIFGDGG